MGLGNSHSRTAVTKPAALVPMRHGRYSATVGALPLNSECCSVSQASMYLCSSPRSLNRWLLVILNAAASPTGLKLLKVGGRGGSAGFPGGGLSAKYRSKCTMLASLKLFEALRSDTRSVSSGLSVSNNLHSATLNCLSAVGVQDNLPSSHR